VPGPGAAPSLIHWAVARLLQGNSASTAFAATWAAGWLKLNQHRWQAPSPKPQTAKHNKAAEQQ